MTRSRVLAVLLACAVMVVLRPVAATQTPQKAVLVLIPLQRGSSMSVDIDGTIRAVLNEGLAGQLDYYTEYLDIARFPEPDYQPAVRDFFKRKYASQSFDVVVATTNAMIDFVNAYRDELFPGAAVVFAAGSPRPGPKATGVVFPLDLKSTIDVAIRLHPDLREVFVVSGASDADGFYRDLARGQLLAFDGRVGFTYLSGLAMPDLLLRVSELPPHTIVYFLSFFEDSQGSKFDELKALDRVAAAANVPTYAWIDTRAGSGSVGGSVLNVEIAASALANVALRVLKGESPESIPMREIDPKITQFDWRQLRRWGISEALLPAGSLIRFRQPSLWDQYKVYIIGSASVVVLQTALITGLLVQRGRRRRVENSLRESEAALRTSNEQTLNLAGRLITAQEDERRRISRDLHDDINQRLALLSVQMELMNEESEIEAGARAGRIAAQLRELSSDVHKLSHQLHPAKVEQLGLVTAAQSWCDEVARKSGVYIEFTAQNVPADLEPGISLCMYRVIQESLRNVVRHSHATAARVELTGETDGLKLTITDQGLGFDINETKHTAGLGLVSMHERMRLLHGTIVVSSKPGQGTQVTAIAPLLPMPTPAG